MSRPKYDRKRHKLTFFAFGRKLSIDVILLKSFILATLYFFLVFSFMPPIYALILLVATALAVPLGFGDPDDWDFALCMALSASIGAGMTAHFGPLAGAIGATLTFGVVMAILSNITNGDSITIPPEKEEDQDSDDKGSA
ncbi:MAG: hypothetical protein ABGW50_01665 [Thermococcus sp.]